MRRGRKPKAIELRDGAMMISARMPTDLVLGLEREVLREGHGATRTGLIIEAVRDWLRRRSAS